MSVFVTTFNPLKQIKPENLFLSVYMSDVPDDSLLLPEHKLYMYYTGDIHCLGVQCGWYGMFVCSLSLIC